MHGFFKYRLAVHIFSGLALLTAPAVYAQDETTRTTAQTTESADSEQMDVVMAAMADAFTAEPLTTEQEARLPAASQAVMAVMPDGSYARMMREVLGKQMGLMIDTIAPQTMPTRELSQALGQDYATVSALSPEQQQRLTAIIDPAHPQRVGLVVDSINEAMIDVFSQVEPALREGLAKAYAVRFNDTQLDAINAFFATETGAYYASESMQVFADPQTMQASMQAMPLVMERIRLVMDDIRAAEAELPEKRNYRALNTDERREIADMLDITPDELQQTMDKNEGDNTEQGDDTK